jgi:hypothetical protein
MDAAKKTKIEKRIVIGLGAVFAVTFLMGPLRNLSLFRDSSSRVGAAGDAEKIDMSKPLTAMLQEGWKRTEPAPEPASPQTPASPPAYTAFTLRDPFSNPLLELTRPVQAGASGSGAASPGTPQAGSSPVRPPPELNVQGILWGGTEPKAIINDQVYGVRDVVAGSQILRIDRDGVLIDHYGTPHRYAPSLPAPKGVAGAMAGSSRGR